MSNIVRRITVLEGRYRPHADYSARIPDWMRPWLNPLSIKDLEILEAGGWVDEADGDLENLSPEDRVRFYDLVRSWETFQEVRQS